MTFVDVKKECHSIEEAIKKLKRRCEGAGIPKELKKREHYESPSVLKQKKFSQMKKKKRRTKNSNKNNKKKS